MTTLSLNNNVKSPSHVQLFDEKDSGSLAHLIYGFVAGSDAVGTKGSVVMASLFVGYQLSQSPYVPWQRTAGEIMEFGLGMLAGILLQPMI